MPLLNRPALVILAAALTVSAAVTYAQTRAAEPVMCGDDEVWMVGEPGPQATITGLRIPPSARLDDGVTFCLRGAIVRATEVRLLERNGERTFTLNGTVTLTIPAR